jgi:hypothetical protein
MASSGIRGRIFMTTNITKLKPLRLFFVDVLEVFGVSEKSAYNSGIQNCIQSETEAISTETLKYLFFVCTKLMSFADIT